MRKFLVSVDRQPPYEIEAPTSADAVLAAMDRHPEAAHIEVKSCGRT